MAGTSWRLEGLSLASAAVSGFLLRQSGLDVAVTNKRFLMVGSNAGRKLQDTLSPSPLGNLYLQKSEQLET